MNFVNDIKESCDNIEDRIYELNNILRENSSNEDVILQLNDILNLVKNIKASVNEENAYNVRSELMSIQKDIDLLFDESVSTK